MHEYSIVQALLEQCEAQARAHDAEKITKVELKIGVLTGVEPHLLKTAFNTFKEKTICEEAELILRMQPVVIYCSECEAEFTLAEHDYTCPHCRGNLIRILEGEEMLLMRLEME